MCSPCLAMQCSAMQLRFAIDYILSNECRMKINSFCSCVWQIFLAHSIYIWMTIPYFRLKNKTITIFQPNYSHCQQNAQMGSVLEPTGGCRTLHFNKQPNEKPCHRKTKPQNSFNIIAKRVMRETQSISYAIAKPGKTQHNNRPWQKKKMTYEHTTLLLPFTFAVSFSLSLRLNVCNWKLISTKLE